MNYFYQVTFTYQNRGILLNFELPEVLRQESDIRSEILKRYPEYLPSLITNLKSVIVSAQWAKTKCAV